MIIVDQFLTRYIHQVKHPLSEIETVKIDQYFKHVYLAKYKATSYDKIITQLIRRNIAFSEGINNISPSVAKVKEVYHIYRSGSGASSPSCNLPRYGSTSKPHNSNSRYLDHYGSRRSKQYRVLKFGDTILEKSLERELDENSNSPPHEEDRRDIEESDPKDQNIYCSSG